MSEDELNQLDLRVFIVRKASNGWILDARSEFRMVADETTAKSMYVFKSLKKMFEWLEQIGYR